MPRITINEINATSQTPSTATVGKPVAFIGPASDGAVNSPVLVSSLAAFEAAFGTLVPTESPYAYLAAKECAYRGNPVLYTRIANTAVKANSIITSDETQILKVEYKNSGREGNLYSYTLIPLSGSTTSYTLTIYKSGIKLTQAIINQGSNTDITLYNGVLVITKILNASTQEPNWTSSVSYAGTDATATSLTGGTDGNTYISSGGTTYTQLFADVQAALLVLQDSSLYDFVNISIPGMCHITNGTNYIWQLLADFTCGTSLVSGFTVTTTDDKVALVDAAPTTTAVSSVLTDLGMNATTQLPQLAVFYPWFNGILTGSDTVRSLPPTIAYLEKFCDLQSDGIPCRAVAGPANSGIAGIKSITPFIGTIDSETANNSLINPIVYHRSFGYFIDGNNIKNPANSKSYQQLSIRYTINYIKKYLNDLCYRLSYSVNSAIARTQFQGEATKLLDSLKVAEFIYAYKVVVNQTASDIRDGIINVAISVYPTPALDQFVINLRIVNDENNL